MNLGKKIKKLREFKNLTQEFCASELSMSQGSYSKLEANETEITYSKLEQIAALFELQVEDIIGFNEKMVFNIMHNKKASGLTINQVSLSEKKLYEEYIQTLKAEIKYLKSAMDKLLKSNGRK